MTTSKISSNTRCRPHLGTLVRVQLSTEKEEDFHAAFDAIADVEMRLSFFDSRSELRRYNAGDDFDLSVDFLALRDFAIDLRDASEGAFTPYLDEQRGGQPKRALDLGGIAKGLAVDRAVERISKGQSGFVEAGGDIRFFGSIDWVATVRLGIPPNVFQRQIRLRQPSLATSAPGAAQKFGDSKTFYGKNRWPAGTSLAVAAPSCMLADGLTKVGLFADKKIVQKLADQFRADFFYFDEAGECFERVECASPKT